MIRSCRWQVGSTILFDLYAGERHAVIQPHEEYLLVLAGAGDFPQLQRIQTNFYGRFSIEPECAGRLVHELLQLHEQHAGQGDKALAQTVLRLAQFFSFAWRNDVLVRCTGD